MRILPLLLLIGCSAAPPRVVEFDSTPIETVRSTSGALSLAVYAPAAQSLRGASELELTISDASGVPIDGLTLDVVPWMPSHAHGTSVVTLVEPIGNGSYVVRDVNLFMPGRWQLRVSVTGPMSDSLTPILDVP